MLRQTPLAVAALIVVTSCTAPSPTPSFWQQNPLGAPISISSPSSGDALTTQRVDVSGTGPPGIAIEIVVANSFDVLLRAGASRVTVSSDSVWTGSVDLSPGDNIILARYSWIGIDQTRLTKVEDWVVVTYVPPSTPDPRPAWQEGVCDGVNSLHLAWHALLHAYDRFPSDQDGAADWAQSALDEIGNMEDHLRSVPPLPGRDHLVDLMRQLATSVSDDADTFVSGYRPTGSSLTSQIDLDQEIFREADRLAASEDVSCSLLYAWQ